MPAMHLFLRHPPLPRMQGVCYGRLDAAVDAAALAGAAARLAPRLPPWPIATSPRLRCRRLAEALQARRAADAHAVPALRIEPRLAEIDFGEWEGHPWDALPRAALDAWSRDVAGFAPPGGESFAQLIARVAAALEALDAPHVLVTHAGVIRAAHHLAGHPLEAAAALAVPHLEPLAIVPPPR